MKQRLGWIDIAKGICLIAVVLGHMGIEAFGFVYSFHLTTFFILCGYTLRKTELTPEYLKQKFERLMIPYFLTCAAVVAMDVINSIVIHRAVSVYNITNVLCRGIVKTFFGSGDVLNFGSIQLGKGIGAIWFLPAMFFALIAVQLVLRLRSKATQAAVAAVLFLTAAITATVFWMPFSIQAALFSVPFILIGKWIKEYDVLEKLKWWHYLLMLAVFAGGCYFKVAQVFYMVGCAAKDWLFTPLCAVCSSLCVIGLSRLIRRCPPLEFVGKHSLIFLCVHLLEINTLSRYFTKARELLHIPHTTLTRFLTEMLFISVVSAALVWLSARRKNAPPPAVGNRDRSMDILRAVLILLMIVGHTGIDYGFSRFIYSFHMMAFVMVSGYFYNGSLPLWVNVKKALKTLWPYLVFIVLHFLLIPGDPLARLKTMALGISYTKELFQGTASVGPVYFILMLCVLKIVYSLVDRIRNEIAKHAVVLAVFSLGLLLGHYGFWLPWTIDGALVSLLFYHVAYYFKKYDLLKKLTQLPAVYFPLACIWAFMIYAGSMELAMRRFGNVGLTVAGVLCAFIVCYLLCHYLAEKLPRWVSWIAGLIGQSTAYILVIHTLFHNRIERFAATTLGLNPQNIFNLGFCIVILVAVSVLCRLAVTHLKKLVRRKPLPAA